MREHEFSLGQLCVTRRAARAFPRNFIVQCLVRHSNGDWGELCSEDKIANEKSVIMGMQILSAYTFQGSKLWIVTEWDNSATTVLLPEEY